MSSSLGVMQLSLLTGFLVALTLAMASGWLYPCLKSTVKSLAPPTQAGLLLLCSRPSDMTFIPPRRLLFLSRKGFLFLLLTAAAGVPAAENPGVIDLDQALARTLTDSPVLKAQGYALTAQEARVLQSTIGPRPELFVQLENVLGTGQNTAFDSAQTTINIAWILERGVRERLVEAERANLPVIEAEIAIRRLDIAAETARRYIECLFLQARMINAEEGIRLAEQAMEAIASRVTAGSAPNAELARARAELARRELTLEDIGHELLSAYYRLAAQWGESEPRFSRVAGDILTMPQIDSFESLRNRLQDNPDLAIFASRQRLLEARLRLEQASNRKSWRVSTGLRRIEATDDYAIVADLALPLGRQDSNRGRVEEARAAIARSGLESEAEQVRLETELFVIYQELNHSVHVRTALADEILPLYEEALEETQAAYESGRYSYLEWNDAQNDFLASRAELIEASAGIYRNLIELERITGVSVELPQL